MLSPQTKGVLETLMAALGEAEQEFTSHAMIEKLAGNVVKEAASKGMAAGVRLTIIAISETLAGMERELSEAAAHPMNKDYLQEAAKAVQARLPDQHGFILLVTPFGEGKRLVYVSTFERSDALNVLKEFLLRNDQAENWMKHIE